MNLQNKELREELRDIVTRKGMSGRIPEILELELDDLETLIQRERYKAQIEENKRWVSIRRQLSDKLLESNTTGQPSFTQQANDQVIRDHEVRITEVESLLEKQ